MTGTVDYFDPVKGLGSIKGDNGQVFFFKYYSLPKQNGKYIVLEKGDKVSFDTDFDIYMGDEAINIQKIAKP